MGEKGRHLGIRTATARSTRLTHLIAPFIAIAPLLGSQGCLPKQGACIQTQTASQIGTDGTEPTTKTADAAKEREAPRCQLEGLSMRYERDGRSTLIPMVIGDGESIAEVVCRERNMIIRTDMNLVIVNFPDMVIPLGEGRIGFTNSISFSFDISDIVPKMVAWTYSQEEAVFLTDQRELIVRDFSPHHSRKAFRVPAKTEGAVMAYSDGLLYILFRSGHLMASAPGKPDYHMAKTPPLGDDAALFELDGSMMIGAPGAEGYRIRVGEGFETLEFESARSRP
jgi:hypothetical protein